MDRILGSGKPERLDTSCDDGNPGDSAELADITALTVDAVVNASNPSLLGGGGVDGAIHRAAGPELVSECRLLGAANRAAPRRPRATRLPAKWVIHTVGPVWHGGDYGEPDQLRSCYQAALRVANDLGARTVAFPAISTGIYPGYPSELAAHVQVQAIRESRMGRIEEVILVAFDPAINRRYTRLASSLAETASARAASTPNLLHSARSAGTGRSIPQRRLYRRVSESTWTRRLTSIYR